VLSWRSAPVGKQVERIFQPTKQCFDCSVLAGHLLQKRGVKVILLVKQKHFALIGSLFERYIIVLSKPIMAKPSLKISDKWLKKKRNEIFITP